MKNRRALSGLLMAGALTLSFSPSNDNEMTNIPAYLNNLIDQKNSPSVQYMFFDTDSIIYEYRTGSADLMHSKPVQSTTTYNLFSVTKTFTAIAILQLAEKGEIKLDDPVCYYLPEFPYHREITIRQLLTHTSGIPNPLPLAWTHLPYEHKTFCRDDFFNGIFSENPELMFNPGSKFAYSNLGYIILGQLIERLSGQSYECYATDHIIGKACIDPSRLSFEIDPNLHAIGYHKRWSFSNAVLGVLIDKGKFMGEAQDSWKPFNPFYINGTPYGGLIGSGYGLTEYAQALLRSDSGLLSDTSKAILFSENTAGNKPTGMALSWFTGNLKGNRFVTHAGGGGGYYVELRLYPDLGVGSVVLFNRTGWKDERFLDRIDTQFLSDNNSQLK